MKDSFVFKKSLGQNFISDKGIIQKIVDGASVDKNTLVVEIGPGKGAITSLLVKRAGYLLVYEIDKRLERGLNLLLNDYENKKIVIDDFLNVDIDKEISDYDFEKWYVVANLPYYITTVIIEKLMKCKNRPSRMVLMVQKEVAMRLSAKPGSRDYGAFTVILNCFYDVSLLFEVKRDYFEPVPNVDSAVIRLDRKDDISGVDTFKLEKVVRDCFCHKRKNLRNNLNGYDLDKVSMVLNKYGMSLNNRAEELPLEVFIDLMSVLYLGKE